MPPVGDPLRIARDRAAGADLVVLLLDHEFPIDEGYVTGTSRTMTGYPALDEDSVAWALWDSPMSIIHEIGHLLGGGHATGTAGSSHLTDYAYAHTLSDRPQPVGTVMSYESARVLAFSNPSMLYDGEPLGSTTSDNACVLEATGGYASALYEIWNGTLDVDLEIDTSSCTTPASSTTVFCRGGLFTSESDLERLRGCTDIFGPVTLAGEVSVLEPMSEVRAIHSLDDGPDRGDLTITSPDLTDLAPLASLTNIEGTLSIDGTQLRNLTGLGTLETLGGLTIVDNEYLTATSPLQVPARVASAVTISSNPRLGSLAALSRLETVSGDLYVANNTSLVWVSGTLSALRTVSGNMELSGIWARGTTSTTTATGVLDSLRALDSVGGNLTLRNIANLRHLSVPGLATVGGVTSILGLPMPRPRAAVCAFPELVCDTITTDASSAHCTFGGP